MKRINLLHLITGLEPAGAENLLVDIVRRLDKKRFRVVVGYIYGQGTLAAEIRGTGVKVIDLSRNEKIDPFLMIRLFLLIRKERIRIVHTHLVHASIVGRIAAKLAGVGRIITTRHYAYYHKQKGLVNWIERKTAVFNNEFIAISNAVKEHMIKTEKYGPERIAVLYNAVDLDLLDSSDGEITERDSGFLIGSVGRLHPSKGYDTLLKSMPQVIKRFPQAKLMIIGDGTQRDHLQRICADLGISEHVVFLGTKTHAQVIDFLKKLDLFVLASNWEGFGLVLVEAMALGKPVVATNVGGIREIVQDGQTGYLVPPGQPDALASRMIRLLEDQPLSREMAKMARKRVEANFSMKRMIYGLDQLYRKLVTPPARLSEREQGCW